MDFTPVTAEAVSQTIEACFPIAREVNLASFTDTATGRTKTLEATIYGYWDGVVYHFESVDYCLNVTCSESPLTMLTPFDTSDEAIVAYNALDLAELKPEEWPEPLTLPVFPPTED